MRILLFAYLGLWAIGILGSVIFLFVLLGQRIEERKKEKKDHKDYDQY